MQKVSKAYKESMKSPVRNRAYIKSTIGIINQDAQDNVQAPKDNNNLTYYSDSIKIFNGYEVEKVYATSEQDFSHVDGSMYFLPKESYSGQFYNNGAVSNLILGNFYVNFNGITGFDIKGLTIDFGEYYPDLFIVEWDSGQNTYQNNQRIFVTEDVFYGVSYFKITALSMVNGQGRLRIYQFTCGISKTFTNKEVRNYSFTDYVSSITESIPSQDMSLEVDNQNLYYSVDNPESAFSFLKVGQEVKTSFGYDADGTGNIEWLKPHTCYLKSWTADDVKAKFTATDQFDYMTDIYYGGIYRENGISLYDLAIDVLQDMGITEEKDFYIDPYLKKVIVYNPLPPVKHSEALQIIANAGRCILCQDRDKRIRMKASFVPDMEASVNNKTEYSKIDKLLKSTKKDAYAICSNDFSVVDGSLFFVPSDGTYLETGYVSNSIADVSGKFDLNPKITINMEAAFTAYGIIIKFRNVAPQQFVITTYYEDAKVEQLTIDNPDLEYVNYDEFEYFDRMEIEFTKGYPNARITVDTILINDITDYILTRTYDILSNPSGTRQNKIKSINVQRNVYRENSEIKDLISEELILNLGTTEYDVYFNNPSYDLNISIENSDIVATIIKQSNYICAVRFENVRADSMVIKYTITGREYIVDNVYFNVKHNEQGEIKTWNNPLVSTMEHAKDLEEWLASYFLGEVEYQISWRGDPRTDANDLFYLELKDRENALIRGYQKQLTFNGAWKETLKARRAVMSWQ